jgi:hypothetical protein
MLQVVDNLMPTYPPVAQLDKVLSSGAKGRRFESGPASVRHNSANQRSTNSLGKLIDADEAICHSARMAVTGSTLAACIAGRRLPLTAMTSARAEAAM